MHDALGMYAQHVEQRADELRERRFADPAEAERGERDAELAGGQIRIEAAVHDAEDAAAQAVLARERLDARRAQFDEAEFGRDEKAVEGYQEQRADQREDL